jgi:hypothetical protein
MAVILAARYVALGLRAGAILAVPGGLCAEEVAVMAATKQKAGTMSASLDRIEATSAEILKALERRGRALRALEKRISALEAERGAS